MTLPYETDEGWGPLREPPHVSREFGPTDLAWRENAWLIYWDPGNDLYGSVHLSTSPNAGGRRARSSLSLGGRSADLVEPLEPMQMTSASIKLDLDGALSVRGADMVIDLTITPRHAPVDFTNARSVPGLSDAEPIRHFQQTGVVRGRAQLGADATDFQGLCFRDRTWGFRDEIAVWDEYYAVLVCWDDLDLTMMKIRTGTGDHHHGFVMGSRSDVIVATSIRRDSWGDPTRVDCVLADGGAFGFDVSRPFASSGVPMGEPAGAAAILARDTFVEVRTDDGDVGFGIIEQGIQYRMA